MHHLHLICSMVLLISLLAWRISLLFFLFCCFFSPLSPLLLFLPVLSLIFALFPSIKKQPFYLRLSHFSDMSMQFSSLPGAEGFGVDSSLRHLTPCYERTEHLPTLPRECRALPSETRALSTSTQGRSPKAVPFHGPGEDPTCSPAETGVSTVLQPHGFNSSSSLL